MQNNISSCYHLFTSLKGNNYMEIHRDIFEFQQTMSVPGNTPL